MDRRQEQIMDRAFWCVIIVICIITGIFIALVTLFCIEQIIEKGNLFHKSSPMQQIHFLYGKCDRCGDEFVITTTNQNNDTQPIQTVKIFYTKNSINLVKMVKSIIHQI